MQQQPPRVRRSQRSRAQYPDDAARRAQYPEYPDYPAQSAAPAQADYSAQGAPVQNRPAYPSPNAPYARPQQPAYPPVYGAGDPPYPPQYTGRTTGGGQWGGNERPPRSRSHEGIWLCIIIVCIIALALGGWAVSSLYGAYYPAFREKAAALRTSAFYTGVHVDNVHLGGLTYNEAKALLARNAAYNDQSFALTVKVDSYTWRITQSELPLERNIDAVLNEAFSIGRQGTAGTLGTEQTPFEARYQHMLQTGQSGAYLYTRVTYDSAAVRRLAETIARSVYMEPVDAMIYSFDFNTRGFSFTQEQNGRSISAETVYNGIIAQLDAQNYNATVALASDTTYPTVTSAQLMSNFGKISTYTTTTTADYNRNNNISLAAAAVTKVVEPGETFSFNDATGRRLESKGYLPAGAIASGASVEEVGGGVCQVSSTLFNASAMANMQIVYSSPHAWPSSYVDPGRDATVDWQSYQSLEQSLDFKFRNNSDFPVFIVSYITGKFTGKCKCTVEIYGVSLGQGVSIQLQTELISQTPAPTEVIRQYSAEIPYGTEQVVRKARPGYVYKTYRVFYQNGAETGRELLRTSTYKTYTQLIEYNY